ncbi:MAG: DUF1415 domain-containing protein [Gammaproteobacteria bacterium]|nr:DUF1415 domain-containing protein [Gammaproteobacteria bacterium]
MDHPTAILATERWLVHVVIGLNICPFAQREWVRESVRLHVTEANNEAELLAELEHELTLLQNDKSVVTTLLIHPHAFLDFEEYNQFLGVAENLLQVMGLSGEIQIASFHPQYKFAGTKEDDAENYTNRSPYPMLHLLRESSVTHAVEGYADVEGIPQRNIELMRQLGSDFLAGILLACQNYTGHADDG